MEKEMTIADAIKEFKDELGEEVTLVAVSKTKPNELLMQAYDAGQRDFGENKIQEMTDKAASLPEDIRWHMVGHVQSNKVKYMAPYVYMVHAVDKYKTLKEINKRAKQNDRSINCLLQLKIAEEDSKFGLSEADLKELLRKPELKELKNIRLSGLMGMATFTDDEDQVHQEFDQLERVYFELKEEFGFDTLSMGMSGDYQLALKHHTNMVRIGSSIFGKRD
ncbi:MAG: YggS family pyridoxal phosphate-dependent enzyme [Psychroflexus sp.]|jgi:pyridoxal phosphate enzyme (YggS family)|nr:YggS family pyridoxal phosphate-dependent enzyme [Psychroflexus sp.]MDR9448434.1 YggS family pyridoxal phosphate-dependent enzyme [Psychroflexus sp.]